MSIKGYLSDISFAELLKIVSKYNGRLGIWNFQEKKQYECFLQNENIVYFNVNGQNVSDNTLINSFLSEISCDKRSYYAFQKDVILDSKSQINLSVSKILSSIVLSNLNLEEIEENLPNPHTKFNIVPDFSEESLGDLQEFWDVAATHLQLGCSSSEIAELFRMDVKEVQANFYKLRTIKAIRPVRLFTVNRAVSQAKKAGANLQTLTSLRNSKKSETTVVNTTVNQVSDNPDSISISQVSNNISNLPIENTSNVDLLPVENANISEVSLVTDIIQKEEDITLSQFELGKVVEFPVNNNIVNTYLPTEDSKTINSNQVQLNSQTNVINTTEEKATNVESFVKTPIFDLDSIGYKQGIVRRMLSSLFSRKAS